MMDAAGSRRVAALLLLAPTVALMAVFFVWPLADIFVRSLDPAGEASLSAPQLDHYGDLFADPVLRAVMRQTAEIALLATVATTIIAFPTAYLLSRLSGRVAAVVLTLILVPFWVSILVRLFALTQVLGQEGLVNDAAGLVGLGPFELVFNTPATVVGMVNYLLPYMILILYAGMAGIDTSLLAAARSLGASGRQIFFGVYLPLVRAALISGVLLIFVLSLGFFLTPAILGGPQNTTVAVYIQQQIDNFQWGSASAIGIVLLVITVVGYVLAMRMLDPRQIAGGSGVGKGSQAQMPLSVRSPLTIVLWIATAVAVALLVVPLLVVVASSVGTSSTIAFPPDGFTLEWYTAAFDDPIWRDSIVKSLIAAAGTAVLTTALALAAARSLTHVRSPALRACLLGAAYAPLVVPVILLAIGNFDIQVRLGLIGSTIGLILIHTVVAFPFAFAILSSALGGVDPQLEAAAWTLGASRIRTFWTLVVPVIGSSIAGALAISFMTSWDEAVVALFQTEFEKTLPVTIYEFLESGLQPTVPAVATTLILLVLAGLAIASAVRYRRGRQLSGSRA